MSWPASLCEDDALLYIDDAHGFGVVGHRDTNEFSHDGMSGDGLIRHQGESYENVVFVAGMSKAYLSLLAFLAVPTPLNNLLKVATPSTCSWALCRSPPSPPR